MHDARVVIIWREHHGLAGNHPVVDNALPLLNDQGLVAAELAERKGRVFWATCQFRILIPGILSLSHWNRTYLSLSGRWCSLPHFHDVSQFVGSIVGCIPGNVGEVHPPRSWSSRVISSGESVAFCIIRDEESVIGHVIVGIELAVSVLRDTVYGDTISIPDLLKDEAVSSLETREAPESIIPNVDCGVEGDFAFVANNMVPVAVSDVNQTVVSPGPPVR